MEMDVTRLPEDYIAAEHELGAHNYKPLDVVLTRGEGVWLWDVDGNRYMDCLAAYSAVNQGHCHPKILAAMTEQAAKLLPRIRTFVNETGLLLFGARLGDITPDGV